MKAALTLIAAAALLVACTTPVAERQPAPFATPAQFAAAPQSEGATPALWQSFAPSEALQAVVQRTLANNLDLRAAAARLAQARALADAAGVARLPVGGSGASVARTRAPKDGGGHETSTGYAATGFDARWEVDLWGGIAAGSRSAALSAEASSLDRDALRLSLAAEAMRLHLEAEGLARRLQLARDTLGVQRQVMELIKARLDAGRGTALDSARAESLLATTEASVPALQRAACNARLALLVLQGQTPLAEGCDTAANDLPQPLPRNLGAIPAPEQLLARRPDVRAAELAAQAAGARIQQAYANRWPRLSLSGEVGWSAGSGSDLFKSGNLVSGVAAALRWDWLDFGARKAEQGAAEAGFQAAVAQAQAAQLAALQETQSALLGLARTEEQAIAQRRAAEASTRAQSIARARFEAGASDFLQLLDAERERLAAQDALIQVEVARATALLALHKALAGPLE
jgi:NodT family efflux transporter outer membrane factor (OMF) lipoprotein